MSGTEFSDSLTFMILFALKNVNGLIISFFISFIYITYMFLSHQAIFTAYANTIERGAYMTNNMNPALNNMPISPMTPQVIQTKFGDINGDGLLETVLLMGTKTPDSPLWKNLTLAVFYGQTHQFEKITLRQSVGYNPTIFLGDFTGNHQDDILAISDTGGSGGIINGEIFASINGKIRSIFDAESLVIS